MIDPVTVRRRFRFSLRTTFVVLTAVAVSAWWTMDSWAPWNSDPDEWIYIAEVGDQKTAHAMMELLTASGVESGYEGSVTYSVSVSRRDARRACKLIRDAGPKLGPYQNWLANY